MLYELCKSRRKTYFTFVLILILLEYALWDFSYPHSLKLEEVLILILLEYALWVLKSGAKAVKGLVLILILLEYALWVTMTLS